MAYLLTLRADTVQGYRRKARRDFRKMTFIYFGVLRLAYSLHIILSSSLGPLIFLIS
jgi:hypothetical protein